MVASEIMHVIRFTLKQEIYRKSSECCHDYHLTGSLLLPRSQSNISLRYESKLFKKKCTNDKKQLYYAADITARTGPYWSYITLKDWVV